MGYGSNDCINLIWGHVVNLKYYDITFLGKFLDIDFGEDPPNDIKDIPEFMEYFSDCPDVHYPCVHNDHDYWIVVGKVLEKHRSSITVFSRAGDEYPMTLTKVQKLVKSQSFNTKQYYHCPSQNFAGYVASDQESLPDLLRHMERLQKDLDLTQVFSLLDQTSQKLTELAIGPP